LGRIASIIDPAKDVLPASNRYIFGINSGLSVTDAQGDGVGVCPMDSPLVSLDQPGCWKFSRDFVPTKPIVYVNLFNNQWNTNFRLWNSGTWTSRVRIWSIDGYNAGPSLVTPSLEARYPLLAAVAEGDGGKLPATQQGLEVSQKGVLVTAFGRNTSGPGVVLRLWEYAGNSGPCQVRLPKGVDVKSVQPIDLRGRPSGDPIPVVNQVFEFKARGFAPASFVFTAGFVPALPLAK
jgi:hypothetical protein